MNIKQAINRIFWRFGGNGNTKPFPVNQGDVDAFNSINEYFEATQAKQYEGSELFAKLYIHLFTQNLEHYKTTVYDNEIRKKIGAILEKPLFQLIEELQESLNQSELYTLLKDTGTTQKHPAIKTEEEINQDKNALSAVSIDKVVDCIENKVWPYETVRDAIAAEVNNMINLHK